MIKFYIDNGREVQAPRKDIVLLPESKEVSISGLIIHLTDKQVSILKDKLLAYDNPETENEDG